MTENPIEQLRGSRRKVADELITKVNSSSKISEEDKQTLINKFIEELSDFENDVNITFEGINYHISTNLLESLQRVFEDYKGGDKQ